MNDYSPLPAVPEQGAPSTAPPGNERALPFAARVAAALFWMFAALYFLRACLYLVGSIQAYGAPQLSDIFTMAQGVFVPAIAVGVAIGLRARRPAAWWAGVLGGAIYGMRVGYELLQLILLKLQGWSRTEVQIALLFIALLVLAAAVIYLLLAQKEYFKG